MIVSNALIGRVAEQKELQRIVESTKSEFLVVYGRRRVGKTFLVREFFGYRFDFQASGLANADTQQQLINFHTVLNKLQEHPHDKPPENWFSAFLRLEDYLESLEGTAKKIVFLDELPWFDTKGSDFVLGLEHFWNSWASARKDIVLVTCGSAASWMTNKLINNSGGLHNRVTKKIKVEPFVLGEVEAMLSVKGCAFDRYQIVQLYMALGGIPHYLDAIRPDLSVAQNIQYLFFDKGALLRNEFFNLYRSIFKKFDAYEQVVEALASKTYGLQRSEIAKLAGLASGGTLSKVLLNLEESGFVTSFTPFGGGKNKMMYRLSDHYSDFYFRFVRDNIHKGANAWLNLIDHPSHRAWEGLAFEQVCLAHVQQIKRALGIQGVLTSESAWRGTYDGQSAQVDLVIDRRDHVINLCEAKFSMEKFTITKKYAEQLREKCGVFRQSTATKKSVFITLITTFGVAHGEHQAGLVQQEVALEDLFAL